MAAATATHSHLNRGRAYRVIFAGILVVAIPLSMATVKVFRDSTAQASVTKITNRWVRQYPSDFMVRSVLVSGSNVEILMTGSERPITIEDLAADIRAKVDQVTDIDLRFVPSRDYRYP